AQPPSEEVMTGTGRQLDQPAVDELVGPAVVGQPVQVLDRVGPVAVVVGDTHWLLSSLGWQPIATTRLVRPHGQHDRAEATGSPPAYDGHATSTRPPPGRGPGAEPPPYRRRQGRGRPSSHSTGKDAEHR